MVVTGMGKYFAIVVMRAVCPRCQRPVRAPTAWSSAWRCDLHGEIHPLAPARLPTIDGLHALVRQALQETNWAAVDAQTDEDIARNVASDPDAAPILSAAETVAAIARSVRKRLGISQAEFSARYHVPIGTLRDWEQNRKQPDAPALAYLRVIAREPDMVAQALRHEAA